MARKRQRMLNWLKGWTLGMIAPKSPAPFSFVRPIISAAPVATLDDWISGNAEYFRQDGHWCIHLHAPEWLIRDIRNDLESKGNIFTVGNYAGRSMLIVAASWDKRTKSDGKPCEGDSISDA